MWLAYGFGTSRDPVGELWVLGDADVIAGRGIEGSAAKTSQKNNKSLVGKCNEVSFDNKSRVRSHYVVLIR